MSQIKQGIYALTDFSSLTDEQVLSKSEQILKVGVSLFQYRDKSRPAEEKLNAASALQSLCKEFNTPFIVNDDVELARTIKADGVHLGKQDVAIQTARDYLGPVIIGRSCYNSLDNARQAQAEGADYLAFGAFYPSSTKPEALRAAPTLLSAAKSELTLPLVAIGGITPKNGKVLLEAGADLLAIIGSLYGVADTASAINEFSQLFLTRATNTYV
jgi:thiamine-phosphate pyrophosphorylase